MNLAIIPARGGSKRIPNKNIRKFNGKPLIAYTIEAAKRAQKFDQIWVSTDSQEIANVAIEYGAEVPFLRPKSLSDDFIGTWPVTKHAIQYCIDERFVPDYCCCIYATAPLLQSMFLKQGLTELQNNQHKSFAFSVTSYPFPIQRSIVLNNGGVAPLFPENIGKRSQDLQEVYHDAGQFYWGRTNEFFSNKSIFSEHSIPIILPRYLVQDIDTMEDWKRAELMHQAYGKDL